MKKNLILLITAIYFIVFGGLFAGLNVFAANIGDLYYFDDNNRHFDLDSMKYVYGSSEQADIGFHSQGSSWYFSGDNRASIKDMGTVDYEKTEVPASGYSSDRITIIQDHVYAVKCGDGSYGIIKVTNYNSEVGSAEFMARTAEPAKKIELYYLSYDYRHFDLETMKNVFSSDKGGDINYKPYSIPCIIGENGASIKDLDAIDYGSAKAPSTGYSTKEIKVVKGHVYTIRSGDKGFYIIKVTNVVNESNIEFIARTAEPESGVTPEPTVTPEPMVTPKPTVKPEPTVAPEPTVKPEPVNNSKTRIEDLYWVENESTFILGGKIFFEDSNGILDPFLSPNKKYIVYSNGSYDLLMYDIARKTKKKIYALKAEEQINYRVYPVGWSQDSKQVAFMTSYRGGFIGGNKLCILNLSNKKVSVVAKGLSSADWGKNGKFVIANGRDVWLVDKLGRNKVKLSVPKARAFFGADNVSFTPDCTKVIYIVADNYYLHDIKANKYKELSIPEEAASNGTVRAGKNGRIAVIQDHVIYIYDPADEEYGLLYEDAESLYPNWINK